MLNELLSLNIFAFMLVFARVGSMIAFAPGVGAAYVSTQIRILLALAVAFAMTPVLTPNLPVTPESYIGLVMLFIGEVLIGVFFGLTAQVLVTALQVAGTLLALFSSLANALINDPVSQQQSSIFANFLTTSGVVLIFATDLHHIWFIAIMESYQVFTPGVPLQTGDVAFMVARNVATAFSIGVKLTIPFILVAMVYYIGLGLLGRLMPALQVFFFGLPVQVSAQIAVLALTFSSVMLVFLRHFQEAFTAFLAS